MSEFSHAAPADFARRLGLSVRKLRRREKQLVTQLGPDRVEALYKFRARQMGPGCEDRFRQGMNWSDKELVWVWRMIERAHDEQVEAWRESVLGGTRSLGADVHGKARSAKAEAAPCASA
jgi:hypothetical protein